MSEIKLILAGTPPGNLDEPIAHIANEPAADTATMSFGTFDAGLNSDRVQAIAGAQQIDLSDSNAVLSYGNAQQKQLQNFTGNTLKNVAGRDLGEIGTLLSSMMEQVQLLGSDSPKSKILQFVQPKPNPQDLRKQYQKTAKVLDKLQKQLEGWRMTLLVDIETLQDLYQQVCARYEELSALIIAGQRQLQQVYDGELATLRQEATSAKSPMAAFAYNDLEKKCENFKNRLHDLELTKTLYQQTAAQIYLAKETDVQLVAQIQSNINHAVTIWQQSVTAALIDLRITELKETDAKLFTAISDVLNLQSAEQKRRGEAMQNF